MIESLPLLTPDPVRGAKLLARCHDRLGRQRRRAESNGMERALMTGFAAHYVMAVAANALSVFAMF